MELHRQVKAGLAAESRQKGVWALAGDDGFKDFRHERLDVGAVRNFGVGHYRRRVGIHEHHPVALSRQRPAGLGPGVVELARLADHDRAGPDNQDR